MTNWIKWGIVSSGWVTLVSAVVLFGLGLSPMAWHAGGYTLTLDLLQTAAVLIAVLAFVVVQTLGAISRLNEIAFGVERVAQDFLAATASVKSVADEITADSPHVAAEIASSYQSLTSYIQSDLLTRFGRRPWGPFRWQTNLITIASCGYLMVATACEAGAVHGRQFPHGGRDRLATRTLFFGGLGGVFHLYDSGLFAEGKIGRNRFVYVQKRTRCDEPRDGKHGSASNGAQRLATWFSDLCRSGLEHDSCFRF